MRYVIYFQVSYSECFDLSELQKKVSEGIIVSVLLLIFSHVDEAYWNPRNIESICEGII